MWKNWLEWWSNNNLYPVYEDLVEQISPNFSFKKKINSQWQSYETLVYKEGASLDINTTWMNEVQKAALIRLIGSLIIHIEVQANTNNLRTVIDRALVAESILKLWKWIALEDGIVINTTVISEELLRAIFLIQKLSATFTFEEWQNLIQRRFIAFWNKILAERNLHTQTAKK